MYIAEYFSRRGKKVILCEKEKDFMQRASYANQARVHNGYHYPRSVLTGMRSRMSFPRFCQEFRDCVDSSFDKYYLIGKLLGNVTCRQFMKFCNRIGALCEPAPAKVSRLVNPNLIEAVFSTTEYAFDAVKLKDIMHRRLNESEVDIRLETTVGLVEKSAAGLTAQLSSVCNTGDLEVLNVDQIYNCTYSMINHILSESKMEKIPIKHEMAEICLVEAPEEIVGMGITVMCGPFFSTMPFPVRNLHSFSHVRYTPHYEWHDKPNKQYLNPHEHFKTAPRKTAWRAMISDAKRYIPILGECKYKESLWEVKSVLPKSEGDDSRPILFKQNHGLEGLHCIMGGKIDNVYDVVQNIEELGLHQ